MGTPPPADSIADRAAIERNNVEFEHQQVLAFTFIARIAAREAQTMFLLRDQLTPEQRDPIGFITVRARIAEAINGALITLTFDLKPTNERIPSAAIGDAAERLGQGDRA